MIHRRTWGLNACHRAAFLLPLIAGVSALLVTPPAQACKCMARPPADLYKDAVAVFEGRVKEAPVPEGEGGMTLRVRFEVVRAWKGIQSEHAVVLTASDSAACGVAFELEHSYLVYASSEGGVLRANSCGGSKPIAEADDDLTAIGMGATTFEPREPAPQADEEEEPPAAGGCASCSVARPDNARAIGALFLLAFLAIRPLRRLLGSPPPWT